ncbi:hypothetical protein ACINK0_17750 (plasmid) [Deinococcus sp. VB343]|uniref:Uncharacterized protein n=1 Tax=Deinococcus sp. VB142 TaxID=3112952 RepID=A0AAU6Q869_9DEIO
MATDFAVQDRVQNAAEQLLLDYVGEMKRQFRQAAGFRGRHARFFWARAENRAQEALDQIELGAAAHQIQDTRGLENLRDAVESSLLGVHSYREQFARVQWMAKSPKDLLARLRERELYPPLPSPLLEWVEDETNGETFNQALFSWSDAA